MIEKVAEANIIEISITSDKKIVKRFLEELHTILNMEQFNIDKHLIIIKTKKEEEQYSTPYTMVDLEYDASDVAARLRELSINEYSETLFDKDDEEPPLLFVFGKDIHNRKVYIKLKIKGEETKKILCVSFHYAKYEMKFPYAK